MKGKLLGKQLGKNLIGEGDRLPDAMSEIGGGGLARVRGHVKSFYSAGERLKAPVSIEP